MKSFFLFLIFIASYFTGIHAQPDNLIVNGNFKTLKAWKTNENLRKNGKITLIPSENGVMIYNPVIDLDGMLYQEIAANGHEWFSYSLRFRGLNSYVIRTKDDGMMTASMGFMSIDKNGRVLSISTPVRISAANWTAAKGTLKVPPGTSKIRVMLSVICGRCSFADVSVTKTEGEEKIISRSNFVPDKGFSVHAYAVDRPFWELFCDDLNDDGKPEITGCDVDGIVTVRNQGSPPFLTYAAGAMAYQFEAADLNNDGTKEILMSSLDPKIPLRAIDLNGNTVRTFNLTKGHERIAVGDMNNDGNPEVAVTVRNGLQGSGIAGGVMVYDSRGEKIWEKTEILREMHFADIHPNPGTELITGGNNISFRIYSMDGKLLDEFNHGRGLLDHFLATDIDNDGKSEIIASFNSGRRITLQCFRDKKLVWENATPLVLGGGQESGMNMASGDFDKTRPGLEIFLAGTHSIFLVDAGGSLIYQNRNESSWEYWQSWADKNINSIDIAFWNEKNPYLYLSSSRLRNSAYYHLNYSDNNDLSFYELPDQEKHLEDIYNTLKKRTVLPSSGKDKIKVFMAQGAFATAPEATLRKWRDVLSEMETPNLEYLVMYEASDLYGHERGQKKTTDQIVERARLLEKVGIPFGYFSTHGGQVWISEEAIRRSKEAAPEMFRFLYIAENLEMLYSPLYKDVLKWTDKTLDFCAAHNMKMIFKEKHDVWGLLPSDKEVSDILFSSAHRNVTVPIWSTNQPYQPEVQLGGMLGLRTAGLCNEFGMSTQYWNWHEWGRYPRGIRDVSATYICPSDIMLRLDLMGIALGGTWIHIEGGQPYLYPDLEKGLVPLANRHRDLAYELVRKNILVPGAVPVNLNKTAVIRSFHGEMEKSKKDQRRIAYPYYDRNTDALRKGFIPARYLFETYTPDAFPWIGYSQAWNVSTCFPTNPNGWIPVLPPSAQLSPFSSTIITDGEKILLGQSWKESAEAAPEVEKIITTGAGDIPFEAPGTCLIIQKNISEKDAYTLIMIDPGYLAPKGVQTTILSRKGNLVKAEDMVGGELLRSSGNSCPVQIQPGAFRVVKVTLEP